MYIFHFRIFLMSVKVKDNNRIYGPNNSSSVQFTVCDVIKALRTAINEFPAKLLDELSNMGVLNS